MGGVLCLESPFLRFFCSPGPVSVRCDTTPSLCVSPDFAASFVPTLASSTTPTSVEDPVGTSYVPESRRVDETKDDGVPAHVKCHVSIFFTMSFILPSVP